MILKCPTCTSKLSIPVEKIRKLKTPKITCGNCNTKIQIQPRVVGCGNCKKEIEYHDFRLDPKKPLKQCPHCLTFNRMPIGKHTFKIHKVPIAMKLTCGKCNTSRELTKGQVEKIKGKSGSMICGNPNCGNKVPFDLRHQPTIISSPEETQVVTSKKEVPSSQQMMKICSTALSFSKILK